MTQQELARLSRISRGTIVEIEAGRSAFHLTLHVLARSMGTTIPAILEKYTTKR